MSSAPFSLSLPDLLGALSRVPKDGANRGPLINGSTWAITSVTTVFVWIRIYTKVSRKNRLWWDDHLLVLGWVFLVIGSALISVAVSLGLGRRISEIDLNNATPLAFRGILVASVISMANSLSKTSFIVTLLRIARNPWFKGVLIFFIVSTNLALVSIALIIWFPCRPIRKAWDVLAEGTCMNPEIIVDWGYVSNTWSAFSDFALAILPWTVILKLQMNRREKLGVAFAMSMGAIAGAMGIIKVIQAKALTDIDATYTTGPLTIASVAETGLTMIAASVPVLRVLFKNFISAYQRYMSSRSGSHSLGSLRRTRYKVWVGSSKDAGAGGTRSLRPSFGLKARQSCKKCRNCRECKCCGGTMPAQSTSQDPCIVPEDMLPLAELPPARILRVQDVDVSHMYLVDMGHGFEFRNLPQGAV